MADWRRYMAHQAFLAKKNTVVQHLDAYRTALDLLAVDVSANHWVAE